MPAYTAFVFANNPTYLQGESYSAEADRSIWEDIISPGTANATGTSVECQVTAPGGMNIQVGTGAVYCRSNPNGKGVYRQVNAAARTLAIGAAHATLPRLDQVIYRVMDATLDTSGLYEGRFEIIPGVATAGATLANRNGAADLTTLAEGSKSVLLLADVLVPPAAVAIGSGDIGDKRPKASLTGRALDIRRLTASEFTALVNPYDKMEIILEVDATAGIYWRFRYRSGSASAYKWEFMGGPPLTAEIATSETTTSVTYADLATVGPSITIPRPGDYNIDFGMRAAHSVASGAASSSLSGGGLTAASTDDVRAFGTGQFDVQRRKLGTGLTATALKMMYEVISAGTGTFLNRRLNITPVRISQ